MRGQARGAVNSYLVWTAGYGVLLGICLALAATVSPWFAVLVVLLAWRLVWNMRRLAQWMRDCSDAVGQ